jgi:hypothetical protein
MSEKMIQVQVPESAYRKLQQAAALTHRSIDEILVNTIDTSLPAPTDLPSEIADELAAMHLLSDAALWAASQPSLSAAQQARLAQLNGLERKLTAAETAEQEALFTAYYHAVLRRSQALALLAQRGHAVTEVELGAELTS